MKMPVHHSVDMGSVCDRGWSLYYCHQHSSSGNPFVNECPHGFAAAKLSLECLKGVFHCFPFSSIFTLSVALF